MKLSEKMNMAIDDKKSTFFALPASTVSIWASEVAQLEADNAALRRENDELRGKAQAVVDGATGGGFDKFSGFDDYIIPYRLVDELADALLTAEEPEDE